MNMKRVTIIGQGNVATHLCVALAGRVDELVNVSSREPEDIPADSDIYIIAVSDDAIATVAASMPGVGGIVAHTAGSVPMEVLRPYFKHIGVFYPLQTFTKGDTLDYSRIPVFVEGNDSTVQSQLLGLASMFTANLFTANSAQRGRIHLASVFASNFANCLWGIADDILRPQGYGVDVLLPLIEASANKLKYMTPAEAQTGPARRGDAKIIELHTRELAGTPYQTIYELLSETILKKYTNSNI